jgi:hypothetical protein
MFRQFKEKNKNVLRLKLKSALKIEQISVVFTYFVPVFKYCYSDSRNL